MSGDHLADYLAQWHDQGELLRVSAEVDLIHEIAAITDRVRRTHPGNPALLFDHVRGHSLPVATNLLGSPRRISSVFGVLSFDQLTRRIDDWLAISLPRGIVETWKLLPRLAELSQWPPTIVKSGLCQQVVKVGRDVNLAELPFLKMWQSDSAPVITAGQLHTRSPKADSVDSTTDSASYRHVSVVPLEVCGHDGLLIHGDEQTELWSLLAEYRTRGQQMPVAIVLGGDPLMHVAAWAPLPARTDRLVFAGFLRNKSVEVVPARSVPIDVPASVEIVIEGYVNPEETWQECSPISRDTGFFVGGQSLPMIHVTAITHRANPVFPAMVTGVAPSESHWLDRACERLLLPIAKMWIPELVDWCFPFSGSCRHFVFASIRKTYAQQVRKVMHALWSLPRIATAKMLVLVDDDIDVQDESAVLARIAAHTDPARDLVLWDGPSDPLDHATATRGVGRKIGIDATLKRSNESGAATQAQPLRSNPEMEEHLNARWSELGLEYRK